MGSRRHNSRFDPLETNIKDIINVNYSDISYHNAFLYIRADSQFDFCIQRPLVVDRIHPFFASHSRLSLHRQGV